MPKNVIGLEPWTPGACRLDLDTRDLEVIAKYSKSPIVRIDNRDKEMCQVMVDLLLMRIVVDNT